MTFKARVFDEPVLEFGDGGQHCDPRQGLREFGPLQPRSDAGAPIITTHDRTYSSDGRHPPSSPSPATRAGIWRCAMPMAPRQLPSLRPPNWANPMA